MLSWFTGTSIGVCLQVIAPPATSACGYMKSWQRKLVWDAYCAALQTRWIQFNLILMFKKSSVNVFIHTCMKECCLDFVIANFQTHYVQKFSTFGSKRLLIWYQLLWSLISLSILKSSCCKLLGFFFSFLFLLAN